MAKFVRTVNKIPFAPVVAIAFGIMSAIFVIALPAWRFQSAIIASGLPTILSIARPPLGDNARGLTALAVGLCMAAVLWLGLSALSILTRGNRKKPKARGRRIERAIVPPNAETGLPQRRPIFAERDLGAPFMSDEVLAQRQEDGAVPPSVLPPAPPIAPATSTDGSAAQPAARAPLPAFAPLPPFAPPPPLADAPDQPTGHWQPIDMPFAAPPAPVAEPMMPPVQPAPVAAAIEPSAYESRAQGSRATEPSVADLMARLDAALERRELHKPDQSPGNVASLRQALGGLSIAGR